MVAKFSALLAVVLCGALIAASSGDDAQAKAKEKPADKGLEFQVIYCEMNYVPVSSIETVNGESKTVLHDMNYSAEEMTRKFNALTADGWEYGGPLTSTKTGTEAGMLFLFQRSRK